MEYRPIPRCVGNDSTQRLSVAVQYSAAQEVAEALGLSVAADPRAAP